MAKSLITRRRTTVLAVAAAALALPLAAAAPAAAAAAPAPQSAVAVAPSAESASEQFVLDFYNEYAEAIRTGDQSAKNELRATRLTQGARDQIAAYEAANPGLDGVVFADRAPVSVTIEGAEGTAGTIWYQVFLNWGDGSGTLLDVGYSNVEHLINNVRIVH